MFYDETVQLPKRPNNAQKPPVTGLKPGPDEGFLSYLARRLTGDWSTSPADNPVEPQGPVYHGNPPPMPASKATSLPEAIGQAIGTAYTPAVNKTSQAIETVANVGGDISKGFHTGAGIPITPPVTPPPVTSSPASTPVSSPAGSLPVGTTGINVTGVNTSDRPGYAARTYTDANNKVIGRGLSSAQGQGGFSGSATDAEAAKNLQARLEQDKAASLVAASDNRGYEAMRDLRAAQMGIPRSQLDMAEGLVARPEEPAKTNPFAMPGDRYGDDIRRRDALLSTINDPTASKSQRAMAATTLNSFMEGAREADKTAAVAKAAGIKSADSPLDQQRFLLDASKFSWQQNVDKANEKRQETLAQNDTAKSRLEQQKYLDERNKTYLDNFTYSDPNAPKSVLATGALQISDATGGKVPPEMVVKTMQDLDKSKGIDWKNSPPKDTQAYLEEVAKLVTAAYKR